MKAIIVEKAGGVENLIYKDIEHPCINANEVLIQTKSISVNPADFKVRMSEEGLNMFYGSERPVILGWDVAGVITAIGNEVKDFAVGDKVFGMVNVPQAGRAYAEYVAAPQNHIAKIPQNISFDEAAASTMAAITALQALKGVKKGNRVLIHAGSGGVGHFAIQIAKSKGAYVITTSSAKNRDFVLSIGANEHVDYRTQALEEATKDIDYVMDTMSGDVLWNSLKVMRKGGSIITLASPPDLIAEVQKIADEIDVKIAFMMAQSNADDINFIKDMLKEGTLKPHISKTFPFTNMADAHKHLEKGRTVGKVVVSL